jgi:hypothetical protein
MKLADMVKMHQQERHAEFWELLWTLIGTISLGLLFFLLNSCLTK